MPRATHIQEVFDALSIDRIIPKVHQPHKLIREGFRVPVYAVNSYEEAVGLLSQYMKYHTQRWLGGPPLSDDIAHARVRTILDKKQGYVLSVKNAIRGRAGGVVALVNEIAEAIEEEALEMYMRYVIDQMICLLDFEQLIILARQYLREYSHLLLPGEPLMSEYELAGNIEALVRYHNSVLQNYRQMVQ
jgi:hypothetical protein